MKKDRTKEEILNQERTFGAATFKHKRKREKIAAESSRRNRNG